MVLALCMFISGRPHHRADRGVFSLIPPLAILSGATTPIEAMPTWLQPVTAINPVKHFAIISRGILLKGSGVDVLYPQLLALAGIALGMVSHSSSPLKNTPAPQSQTPP